MTSAYWPAPAREPQSLLAGFATAGAIATAFLLLTHWPTYSYLVLGGRAPLVYYMLPWIFALGLAFLQPLRALQVLHEPTLAWFMVFVLTGMAWLLISQDMPEEAGQHWRLRVLAMLVFGSALLACAMARRSLVALAILATLLLATALNWYDIFYPLRLVPLGIEAANPGRGAGLFMNANGAAAFIIAATIALLGCVPARWRGALLLLMLLGVAPTFSRFAFVFAALLLVAVLVLRMLDRRQIVLVGVGLAALASGAVLYYQLLVHLGNENVMGRLNWFQTFGREVDFSMRERAEVAAKAWDRFLDSPLVGQGLGATVARGERVGTHNMYLLLMAEQGLVGLALYLSLVGVLFMRGLRLLRDAVGVPLQDAGRVMILYAMFIGVYGLVSHNVLEEPHGMFLLAFVVAGGMDALRTRAWEPA